MIRIAPAIIATIFATGCAKDPSSRISRDPRTKINDAFSMKRLQVVFISLLSWPCLLAADEFRVPDHHKTIQAAIAAANAGDTILVAPGTYHERIVLKPGIAVRSAGQQGNGKLGLKRAEATIIDGGNEAGDSPGVTMAEAATLDGFTVTNIGRYDGEKWQKHWNEKGANQTH